MHSIVVPVRAIAYEPVGVENIHHLFILRLAELRISPLNFKPVSVRIQINGKAPGMAAPLGFAAPLKPYVQAAPKQVNAQPL